MRTYLTILFTFFAFTAYAALVPKEQARNVAHNLYFERASISFPLVYEEIGFSSDFTIDGEGIPALYIFNVSGQRGWVIVAAETNVYPVLAYSKKGSYTPDLMAPAFEWWIENYRQGVQAVRDNNMSSTSEIEEAWTRYSSVIGLNAAKIVTIGPFTTTHWDQGGYYNDECPGGSVTGCVATAMAQMMKFWSHPTKGQSSHTYFHPNYGALSADFQNTTYNWANMPNVVSEPNPDVAKLMYHCGVSVDMNYSPGGSGANMDMAATAFSTYFRYAYYTQCISKANFDDVYWCINIRANLIDRIPVMYAGGSHAFVCDGFEYPDHFHFNFGWGGSSDGYYYLSSIGPSGSYSINQKAILNVYPYEANLTSPNETTEQSTIFRYPELFSAKGLEGALTVFPNPAIDRVRLSLNSLWQGDLTMEVVDVMGRIVMSSILVKGELPQNWDIDISSIPSGLYFIQLSNSEEKVVERIVKR